MIFFSANFRVFFGQLGIILLPTLVLVACQSEPIPANKPVSPRPETVTATSEITSNTPVSPNTPTPIPTVEIPPTLTPTPTPSPTPAPQQGGTAVLGVVGRVKNLNPITDNSPALRELIPLLFDTLLRINPQTAALQPGLAESWEYTDNGRQVIFRLPSNLSWSDGTPLTAAAVAESLEATQHPALRAFSDIGARNDNTLIFTFLTIDCAALTTLAQLPLLPASEITATIPGGSGPFIVSELSADKSALTLIQNPHYHGSPPYLDGLTIRFLPEDEIAIALSEGQFDTIGPIQPSMMNREFLRPDSSLEISNSQFTIHNYPAPQVTYLAINYDPRNDTPLAPETRDALLLALDRESILTEILADEGHLLAGSLLPPHWAANTSLSPPDYQPDTARQLLADAGLRDTDGDGWLDRNGQRLELGIRLNGKNSLHQNLGWLVSSYYRDLGLFVRAESVPFDSVVDDLFTHDFTLAIFSWPLLPDPDQRMFWHSTENEEGMGLNFTSYNNPQVDALLEAGVTVAGCRQQERTNFYTEVQQILAKDRPVDFLLTPHRQLWVAGSLHGLEPGPFASFTWNATRWHLLR